MIEVEFKTINELVKEGYTVEVDMGDVYISKGNFCRELNLCTFSDGYVYAYREGEDLLSDDCDERISKEFIKKINSDELFVTELDNHTLTLKNNLTIEVGCEIIDKKKALEIGKAILRANDYEIE